MVVEKFLVAHCDYDEVQAGNEPIELKGIPAVSMGR